MDKLKNRFGKRLLISILLFAYCSCFADIVVVAEVNNPAFGWIVLLSTLMASSAIVMFILWKRGEQSSNWLKYSAIILAILAVLCVVLLLKTPRKVTDHQYQKVENPFAH